MHGLYVINCALTKVSFCNDRVMPPRNTQRGRDIVPPSAESSHTIPSESVRVQPSPNQPEMNTSTPALRAKKFEQLRKLGAISFSGTLDPAEAEAWLKSTERIFNLMHCTPE